MIENSDVKFAVMKTNTITGINRYLKLFHNHGCSNVQEYIINVGTL